MFVPTSWSSLCDVNSPRRTGPNGEGDKDALDGQGPLHMASQWGQEHIVQCLVEHQADINARVRIKDSGNFFQF